MGSFVGLLIVLNFFFFLGNKDNFDFVKYIYLGIVCGVFLVVIGFFFVKLLEIIDDMVFEEFNILIKLFLK